MLVVTALGGLLGGIVGLILAVPAYVIAGDAIGRLRSSTAWPNAPNPPCTTCSADPRRSTPSPGTPGIHTIRVIRTVVRRSTIAGVLSDDD